MYTPLPDCITFNTPKGSSISISNIAQHADAYLSHLTLNDADHEQLAQYLVEKRKLQWYASRYLLKQLLQTKQMVWLYKDQYGRPYLQDIPYHISLSHTQHKVAAMIHSSLHIGVDVEQFKPKVERIAHKFTTDIECSLMPHHQKIEHLITIWSIKESVYKMYHKKELDFKENIQIQPFSYSYEDIIRVHLVTKNHQQILDVGYKTFDDHVLSWVESDTNSL